MLSGISPPQLAIRSMRSYTGLAQQPPRLVFLKPVRKHTAKKPAFPPGPTHKSRSSYSPSSPPLAIPRQFPRLALTLLLKNRFYRQEASDLLNANNYTRGLHHSMWSVGAHTRVLFRCRSCLPDYNENGRLERRRAKLRLRRG